MTVGENIQKYRNFENKEPNTESEPNESYRFNYSKTELNDYFKSQRKSLSRGYIYYTSDVFLKKKQQIFLKNRLKPRRNGYLLYPMN